MPSQPLRALIAVTAAAVLAVGAWQVSEADAEEQTSFGPGPMCCIG